MRIYCTRGVPSDSPYSYRDRCDRFLEEATAGLGATHGRTLLLHNLANLHRRVEELGGAAVEADGLALVELALAVVGGDALLLARFLETK